MLDLPEMRFLLERAPKYQNQPLPGGASEGDLAAFSQTAAIRLPEQFREWLRFCNGPPIWPAGLYGVATKDRSLDIEEVYRIFPHWKKKRWIPVGNDGAGNYYVIPTGGEYGSGHPVLFVEADKDYSPAYIVASDLWHFLKFLLEAQWEYKELGREPNWPFDQEYVTNRDPQIVTYTNIPTPWAAERTSESN